MKWYVGKTVSVKFANTVVDHSAIYCCVNLCLSTGWCVMTNYRNPGTSQEPGSVRLLTALRRLAPISTGTRKASSHVLPRVLILMVPFCVLVIY